MSFSEPAGPTTATPIALAEALREFGCDRECFAEMVAEFARIGYTQIAAIDLALAAGNAETVANEAHALKGGAAMLTARPLSAAAAILERQAMSGQLDGACEVLARVERELARLERFIKE